MKEDQSSKVRLETRREIFLAGTITGMTLALITSLAVRLVEYYLV